MDVARIHLRLPEKMTDDVETDLTFKLAAAEAIVLDYLKSGASVTWTDPDSTPSLVRAAILLQLGERTGLGGRLEGRLPPDAGQIVIMKGNQLGTARKAVKVIRVLSYFLFFLVIALYAVALWLARGRRRTLLLATGISVVVVGLIVLGVRRYACDYLVNALTTNDADKGAVSRSWAIGTQLLRNVGFNALIYGVVIIFAAWIAGPSRLATWSRRSLAPTMRNYPVIIYLVVAVVLLLVLLAGPTDAQRIYPLLILSAFAFVGTEILRRQTLREFPA